MDDSLMQLVAQWRGKLTIRKMLHLYDQMASVQIVNLDVQTVSLRLNTVTDNTGDLIKQNENKTENNCLSLSTEIWTVFKSMSFKKENFGYRKKHQIIFMCFFLYPSVFVTDGWKTPPARDVTFAVDNDFATSGEPPLVYSHDQQRESPVREDCLIRTKDYMS